MGTAFVAKRLLMVWVSFFVTGLYFTHINAGLEPTLQKRCYIVFSALAAIAMIAAFVVDYRQDRDNVFLRENEGYRPALITVICCYIMSPILFAGLASIVWDWHFEGARSVFRIAWQLLVATGMSRTFYMLIILRAGYAKAQTRNAV